MTSEVVGRFQPMPKAAFLRGVFTYSPEEGILYWNWREDVPLATNRRFAGRQVGSYHSRGLQVRLNDRLLFVHRLIYVILYGDCLGCDDEIDHADLNPFNNRPDNIRKADHGQNSANRQAQCNSQSGFKGVIRLPNGRWRARIAGISLGCYETPEEASNAYGVAAENIYGEFGRQS